MDDTDTPDQIPEGQDNAPPDVPDMDMPVEPVHPDYTAPDAAAPSVCPAPPSDSPTEPDFPAHIRFEFGSVMELKDWAEKWFAWKLGQK